METQELKLNHEELLELYCLVSNRIGDISRLQCTSLSRKYCLRLQDLRLKLNNALKSFSNEN